VEIDITYHYPPELFNLLIDTIPRLSTSKHNLLLFFRGAGVRRADFSDIEAKVATNPGSINKFEITRTILKRLNERGETSLRERRELLKRVVEFEDFSACWPNDQLVAKGLVAEVRQIVNVKDSFTRMKQEREDERSRRIAEKEQELRATQEKRKELEVIKRDICALFASENPRKRGLVLEEIFNRLFKTSGILIRESFHRTGEEGQGIIEQIDGVISLDGEIYLVEMKWLKDKAGVDDVSRHLVRVFTRGSSRGIFISATEYTDPALDTCKDALSKAVVILCSVEEIILLLERSGDLNELLRRKIHAAIIDKKPFLRVLN
jgi:restriction system protein